jgi:hypothetical protein
MTPTLSRKRRRKQYRQAIGKNWRDVMEYERFVASMVRLCDCRPAFHICDGVLAGGSCDRINTDTP